MAEASVADNISAVQYSRGLEMFAMGDTMATIAIATDLTEGEVAWLIQKGDESRSMPCWVVVLAERRAQRARHRDNVGDSLAAGAVQMIDQAQQIAGAAQNLQLVILATHMTHVAGPASQLLQAGKLPGESAEDWIERSQRLIKCLAMDKSTLSTLKVLGNLADIKAPADAYEKVYLNAQRQLHSGLSSALKGFTGKVELGAKATLPAQVTGVETIPGADTAVADPLDIDADFAGMSLEELAEFDRGGDMPDEAYGDGGKVDRLPPDADINWDPTA